jgi:hypothetical protein
MKAFDQCRVGLYAIEGQSPLSRIPAFRITNIVEALAAARAQRSLLSAQTLGSLHLAELDGYVARAWAAIRDSICPVPTDATAKLRRDIAYRDYRQSVVGLDQPHVDMLYEDGTADFRHALETADPVLVSPAVLHRVREARAEELAPALLVEVNEMQFTRDKFAELYEALAAELTGDLTTK